MPLIVTPQFIIFFRSYNNGSFLFYYYACFFLILLVWPLVVAINLKYRLQKRVLYEAIVFNFAFPFVIVLWLIPGGAIAEMTPKDIFEVFIPSFGWGIYFVRSKRCRNTYQDS